MIKPLCFLSFICLFCAQLNAQYTIGIPNIVNYPKEVYKAGSQNWGIAQDKNGIMYFANNEGLVCFDGTFWRTYQLPNKTIIRSVKITDDGRIYVGGQGEFGYFYPNNKGELIYTSLKEKLSKNDLDFADVWTIIPYKNKVFFQSNKQVVEYDHHKLIAYHSIHWNYIETVHSKLLAFEYTIGLVSYENGKWVTFIKPEFFPKNVQIKKAIELGRDSALLFTMRNGVFLLHNNTVSKFNTADLSTITDKIITGVSLISSDEIAITTNLSGCFIINKKGKLLEYFTKQEGIQNNNILSVFFDKDKNLWIGLDNGIDVIAYNNAIKNIFPDKNSKNPGFASAIYDNKLYLGLATGLYKINLKPGNTDLSDLHESFSFVENTKGQVWGLSKVNGSLLMGGASGAFVVKDNTASVFDSTTGFWSFQPLDNQSHSSVFFGGTYNGVNFYNYNAGNVSNPKVHASFESARFIVNDHGTIWIAHPYRGLYKLTLDANHHPVVQFYQDKKRILSANYNAIFKIDDKVILTTEKGIFEYSTAEKDFIHIPWMEKIFEGIPVRFLYKDRYGNLWFCTEDKIGIIDRSSGTGKPVFISELNDKILGGGFQNLNVIDSNNIFIGAEKGFLHFNLAAYQNREKHLNVLIRKVESKDSLLFGGYITSSSVPSIKYKDNSLHFEYSSPAYGEGLNNIEYSYCLSGFDKEWSTWSNKTEKDYTNLPAGNYIFKVKCRNSITNESSVTTYSFTILPPWYQTWWANTAYFILFFGLLYFLYKWQQLKYKKQQLKKLIEQKQRYDEEQKQLQYQHQLEIEQNEKEIIRLNNVRLQAEIEQKNLEEEQKRLQYLHQIEIEKNEKEIVTLKNENLQSKIDHNNKELAASAMNLVRTIEILSKIKEDLIHYHKSLEAGQTGKKFQSIIKTIDNELDHNQQWEQFAIHFDSVHTNYLKKLKEQYPDLTVSDLKLSAYLRLNLTSKEIAQLMGISLRGVETSRYRLRKKLGINNEINLFDFLINVTK